MATDKRLLGGHVGDAAGKRRYVCEKVEKWVSLIGQLAMIAKAHPQAVYTALVKSVQCEWQFLQRTVEGCGHWFEPIEEALSARLLPALLQVPTISPEERRLIALPVRFGGLGIVDPTRTASAAFATSQAATRHLREAIRGAAPLRLAEHRAAMQKARADFKAQKEKECVAELAGLTAAMPVEQQRAVQRAVKHKTGAWLTVMPTARNGNQLCANEWRDGIAFRYGWEPRDLQPRCDGCGEQFDADHALKCRKGGLIIRRHNEVVGELQRLTEMHWPKTVLEPVIRDGNPSLPEGHAERDGLVGDLLIRGGVFSAQTDAIIDVQVIYLNAPSRMRRGQGAGSSGRGRTRRPPDAAIAGGGGEGAAVDAATQPVPSGASAADPAAPAATVAGSCGSKGGEMAVGGGGRSMRHMRGKHGAAAPVRDRRSCGSHSEGAGEGKGVEAQNRMRGNSP